VTLEGVILNFQDEEYRFEFSNTELDILHGILGKSEETNGFLRRVAGDIGVRKFTLARDPYFSRSRSETLEKIQSVRNKAASFAQTLNVINGLNPDPTNRFGKDYRMQLILESMPLVDSKGRISHVDEGFIHDLAERLGSFIHLCEAAPERLRTKTGDATEHDKYRKGFEDTLVFYYRYEYGCYPAKTKDGAFVNAVQIFYTAVDDESFKPNNLNQRLRQAVDRCIELADHTPEEFKKLKPVRRLHPNSKV
tara:strand:- start:2113 stop:2865 length:753 start_codon:yes stop_codon:yes gene_type:complete